MARYQGHFRQNILKLIFFFLMDIKAMNNSDFDALVDVLDE